MMVVLAIGAACSAEVLLNDTFADADRTETALPDESAVWFSHPANLTMGTGSLAINQLAIGSSSKMWTYFAPTGCLHPGGRRSADRHDRVYPRAHVQHDVQKFPVWSI